MLGAFFATNIQHQTIVSAISKPANTAPLSKIRSLKEEQRRIDIPMLKGVVLNPLLSQQCFLVKRYKVTLFKVFNNSKIQQYL
jgi:hypothetical protein